MIKWIYSVYIFALSLTTPLSPIHSLPFPLCTHHGVPKGDEDGVHVAVLFLNVKRLYNAALRVDQVHHVADVAQVVVGEGELHLPAQRLVDIEETLRDADDPAGVLLQQTQKGKRCE